MSPHDDGLAEAVALIRHVRRTGSPAGFVVEPDLLPYIVSRLASLAAGLVDDLGRLTGDDPDALLDEVDCRRMERSLR